MPFLGRWSEVAWLIPLTSETSACSLEGQCVLDARRKRKRKRKRQRKRERNKKRKRREVTETHDERDRHEKKD